MGKAPTEELLTLLRSGHCIPPYWYNDNKIESIRGAGSKKKVRANPVTVFPLWGDATKCGACKGYHGGMYSDVSSRTLLIGCRPLRSLLNCDSARD